MRLIVLLLIIVYQGYGQHKNHLLDAPYGKFAVGLRQESINYNDSIQLTVTTWYPAHPDHKNKPLKIEDCLFLDPLNTNKNPDSIANNIICGDNYKIRNDSLHQFLKTYTKTVLNALPQEQKFPVVMWSYRHGTEYYQFAMNEFLASHGFIVFTVSRAMPAYIMPWEVDSTRREDLVKNYVADMVKLMEVIKRNKYTDPSKIAMFSWSYGGDGAILFQQAHPEIDAVFGFSSVDFSNSFFLGKNLNSFINTSELKRPYFLFYEETSRRDKKFTKEILHRANQNFSSLTLFPRLWHGNFNYMEGFVAGKLNLPIVHPWSKPGKDAVTGYETICRLSLIYLQTLFNNKNARWAEKEINDIKSLIPDGFIK